MLLRSALWVGGALLQVGERALSQETPVTLDLAIWVASLAVGIGGAAAALRALSRRLDQTELTLHLLRDDSHRHIGNTGLHLEAQQVMQKLDCEKVRGDLLRQMTAMKEDLLRELALTREELLQQVTLRVENAVMRGIKRANGGDG